MKFEVEFEKKGAIWTKTFYGSSAGEAFAKCLLKNPNAKLIKATKQGGFSKLDGLELVDGEGTYRMATSASSTPARRTARTKTETGRAKIQTKSWRNSEYAGVG